MFLFCSERNLRICLELGLFRNRNRSWRPRFLVLPLHRERQILDLVREGIAIYHRRLPRSLQIKCLINCSLLKHNKGVFFDWLAVTSMNTNGWRSAQSGVEPTVDTGSSGTDWRTQWQPDSREMIVNKCMDTLKRHLPFSGQEGLQELKLIASRFEEKIYTTATSKSDYLRKISLKMLTMGTKSQNTTATSLPANSASNSENPPDEGIYTLEDTIRSLEI